MFEKARLKLTAWYLLIIMIVSLLFSGVIYYGVNQEFTRIERIEKQRQQEEKEGMLPTLQQFQQQLQQRGSSPLRIVIRPRYDPQMIQSSRMRIITILGLVNLAILLLSGLAGYFLAGRTLRPIQAMVDEQNRFITDASHELRTPLTALRSEIEVALRNKTLTLAQAKKILESNLEEAVSLQSLSDNLLELSQNGRPTNRNVFSSVSLTDCVEGAVKKLGKLAEKRQIRIRKNLQAVLLQGIPDRICELVIILLDNAIKYSPPKSTITITTKKTDGKAILTVSDQGIGIEKKDLPHIFDRFYRANKSRSKDTPGYGLGLSIAKKIVHMHNGTINVESSLGKETTFIVQLPIT